MRRIIQCMGLICAIFVFTITTSAQTTSAQVANKVPVSSEMQAQIQEALRQQSRTSSQKSGRALVATYVGSFNTNDGPYWETNPGVLSGVEAAAFIFGGGPSNYAISTDPNTTDPSTITHTAWASTYGVGGCQEIAEDYSFDLNPPGYKYPEEDNAATSAYVEDNCDEDNTNYVWFVCINPTSGGAIADDQMICEGTVPAALTSTTLAEGHKGTLEYKWQSSTTDATSGFSDIEASNAEGYSPESLTVTSWYKRLARVDCMSDWTEAAESNVVEITVMPLFTAGTISANQTICKNTIPEPLIGVAPTGGYPNYFYQWQQSTDNVDFTDISDATNLDYSPSELTQTTHYRLNQTSVICTNTSIYYDDGSAESGRCVTSGRLGWFGNYFPVSATFSGKIKSVDLYFGSGSASAGLSIDIFDANHLLIGSSVAFTSPNDDWATVQLADIPITGPFYVMVKWNSFDYFTNSLGLDENGPHINDNLAWMIKDGVWSSLSDSFDPGVFLLRPMVESCGDNNTSNSSCGTVTTNTVTINVYDNFTAGEISAIGETICYGNTPAEIGSTTAASGGDETITYSWRSSADNYTEAIVGATSETYTPPAGLTVTTSYQRYANDGTCNTTPELSTGTWTVTVYDQLIAGPKPADQNICYNSIPSTLNGAAPAGGNEPYTYQWQSSEDNLDFSDIASATGLFYSPGALSKTTYYKLIQKSASGCGSVSTNTVTITVYPDLEVGSISADQTICYNTTPDPLTGVAPTGGNPNYFYQWQQSTDNVSFTDINGATNLDYSPIALTQTTHYRLNQTSGCESTSIFFDDGSAEIGWAMNPGYLGWLGNYFPVEPTFSGKIKSVDLYFGWGSASSGLTVDIFDSNHLLIGSSAEFTTPNDDWATVQLADIPITGPFYVMVKWNNLTYYTNYLGYDENGSFVNDNLAWIIEDDVWSPITSIGDYVNPGVFLLRPMVESCGGNGKMAFVPGSMPSVLPKVIKSNAFRQLPEGLAQIQRGINSDQLATPPAPTPFNGRGITSNSLCGTVTTNTVTINVYNNFTPGTIEAAGETICYNTVPAELIGSLSNASGGDESITYSWRSSADSYASDILGATGTTYTPTQTLIATTGYRRYAKDGVCNTDPEESVGTWTVTVEPTPLAGTLTKYPDQVSVEMGTTVSATLTAGSGGNNTDELEYRTHNGTDWSDWEEYTSGNEISSYLKTRIEVRTRRLAVACEPAVATVSWTVETTTVVNVNKDFVYYFIQPAIEAASPGNIIRIGSNTYPENVNTSGRGGLTLQPGFSQGEVTVTGTFTLSAGDVLEMELFADNDYDKFIIEDVASITDASLNIKVMGNYNPAPGTRFTIFTSPNNPGKFTNPTLIKIDGHHFILSYEEDNGTYKVVLTALAPLFKMQINNEGD